jgi:hypothetical protein
MYLHTPWTLIINSLISNVTAPEELLSPPLSTRPQPKCRSTVCRHQILFLTSSIKEPRNRVNDMVFVCLASATVSSQLT